MKSLTRLWSVLAHELGEECLTSVERDIKTVLSRVESEGDSFLTITLPSFCSDFERSLDQGKVSSDLFSGFRRRGGLPAFLSGFLLRVFDSNGILLPDPDIRAVRNIRQLTLVFKKIEDECSPRRKAKAIRAYVACEEALRVTEEELPPSEVRRFGVVGRILFGDVFREVDDMIADFRIHPKHGPGATADKLTGNKKFTQAEWPERLESVFPFGEYVSPSWRYFSSTSVQFLSREQERPVKVTLVPKTQKTPRIIAIEPTAMQYMQQGLMDAIVTGLERKFGTDGIVGFSRQEPNRDMAREGSVMGSLATLDLSEASDRVLNSLVKEICEPWQHLNDAVQATRSLTAQLPGGEVIPLRKFASMGSALCFPFEEMVFLTILADVAWRTDGIHPSSFASYYRGRVRVYGDDIVVPVHLVNETIAALEAFGLKVNSAKSFWTGRFRESCGGDYYDGEWVTPIRQTRRLPSSRREQASIITSMELANAFYKAGLWKTSDFILRHLQSLGYGRTPVPVGVDAVAPVTFQDVIHLATWRRKTQDYRLMTYVQKVRSDENSIDDLAALRKTLTGNFMDPVYKDHLRFSGRPLCVSTKRAWVPATV